MESPELSLAEVAALAPQWESLLDVHYFRDPRTGKERLTYSLAGKCWGRRRGETALYMRWLTIWESERFNRPYRDEADDGISKNQRYRDLAQMDWLEHPGNWPRDRWFPWHKSAECLDPLLLDGAADRVRKGIQKTLQNARKISA